MKSKKQPEKSIRNRRASFDYELGDDFLVGISLTGAETKSLRRGHGHLKGAYVTVSDSKNGGELYLFNATINGDNQVPISEADQTRSRKLLAKRKEIDKIISAKQQGNTIIPTAILTTGRYIKVRISIARGKKKYDKRQSLKAKDENRQIQRDLKQR